jgi:signal transduction histidine kinase
VKRPIHIWMAFAACLALALGALGWISWTTLEFERETEETRRQAALEENVRLALWRMDSILAPLIATESARPYFNYAPFYAAERAYTRMYAEMGPGEVMIPSPLLTKGSPFIKLHFQYDLDSQGRLTSPQAPGGEMGDLAESAGYATREQINQANALLEEFERNVGRREMLASLSEPAPTPLPPTVYWDSMPDLVQTQADNPRESEIAQGNMNTGEANQRLSNYDFQVANGPQQQAVQAREAPLNQSRANLYENDARILVNGRLIVGNNFFQAFEQAPDIRDTILKPIWIDGALILARKIAVNGREYLQGIWLDWPVIREQFLSDIKDLLPGADLAPRLANEQPSPDRSLASLPLRLIPGEAPPNPSPSRFSLRASLGLAWMCLALAAAAVGALLWGAVALSERRAAFVSSVTHELRTPLTSLRMYAEMLSEGMATDESKRRRYLATINAEANRLGHLVENVLAYARIERKRHASRVETLPLSELLARISPRLEERAAQAGMELATIESGSDSIVRADPGAVDQILFNLVDNACKYAVSAEDKRIHLETVCENGAALIIARDHGPGISPRQADRLFRPFSKSARDAADSAPGVGLGLALSRRLARAMGGDLRCDPNGKGARFLLSLPMDKNAAQV